MQDLFQFETKRKAFKTKLGHWCDQLGLELYFIRYFDHGWIISLKCDDKQYHCRAELPPNYDATSEEALTNLVARLHEAKKKDMWP